MNLADLQKHAQKIADQLPLVKAEEAAKIAFVMPLIDLLEYDSGDLTQVEPEHADVKGKKGEKVDYAILKNGKPVLLVEVKICGEDLGQAKYWKQLFSYFATSSATIAALTDGVEWRFFTDLVKPNTMDEEPFLELDLSKPSEDTVRRLRRFAADRFDPKELKAWACRMRDVRAIKEHLEEQGTNPDAKLIKILAQHARPEVKNWTPKLLREIQEATKEAFRDFLHERKGGGPDGKPPEPQPSPGPVSTESGKAKCSWSYRGETNYETSWASLYVAVVSRLHDDCGEIDFYKKLRELIHGNKLGNLGPTPAAAGGSPVGVRGGWWLNKGLGQVAIRKKVAKACEAAGIKYGQDLVLK